MDNKEKNRLRNILKSYQNSSDDLVEEQLIQLEERWDEKNHLIYDRGYSNSQAEGFLDIQGWVRPPGWHSVFFYPDSFRLRNKYAIYLLLIILLVVFYLI